MTCLKNFIYDLANNDTLKRHMQSIGELGWQQLKDEADLDARRIWTEHLPPNDWDKLDCGVVSSYYNHNEGCNSPMKILRLQDGNYLLLNRYSQCALFSPDFLFLEWLPFGKYDDPVTYSDAYRYVYGGDINSDNTKLALVCREHHLVKCFDYLTGDVLWTFGDGASGNASDGRLYNPRDAVWLPNGNLIVTSYNGRGDTSAGTYNNGFIVELDGTTGALVQVHLEYGSANGFFNRGECYNPTGMTLINNLLYICSVGRDEIGCFNVESGFDYVRTYKKPSIINEDGIDPAACCKGPDNSLIVYSSGMKQLAALSLDNGNLIWHAGIPYFDAFSNPRNRAHELWDVFGIIWDDNKQVTLAADFGNRRIQALSKSNIATIQYSVTPPQGYHLAQYPKNYDPETQTVTLLISELQNFGLSKTPGVLILCWEKDAD